MLKFSKPSFIFAIGVVIITAFILFLISNYYSITNLFKNYLIYFNLFTIGFSTYALHTLYLKSKQSQKNNINN